MDKKELRRLIAQEKRNYSVAQKTVEKGESFPQAPSPQATTDKKE